VTITCYSTNKAGQLYAMTDPIAERIRKIGGSTLARSGTSRGSNASKITMPHYVDPLDMLAELRRRQQNVGRSPTRNACGGRMTPRYRLGQLNRELESTRLSDAPGFYSNPAGVAIRRDIEC